MSLTYWDKRSSSFRSLIVFPNPIEIQPITVAARSKAWIVFARLNAEIVGSNPSKRYRCLCVRLFCVCVDLCAGSGFTTGWSLVQGVLPTVKKKDYETEEEARAKKKGSSATDEWMKHRNTDYTNIIGYEGVVCGLSRLSYPWTLMSCVSYINCQLEGSGDIFPRTFWRHTNLIRGALSAASRGLEATYLHIPLCVNYLAL
jgi:hypothetical protein